MDHQMSVAEEKSPVLISEEHQYEDSTNQSMVPADPEEAPVHGVEDQYEDMDTDLAAAADSEEAPVLASTKEHEDEDNESVVSADSQGNILPASEDQYDDLDNEPVAAADAGEVVLAPADGDEHEDSDNESIASADSGEDIEIIEPFEDCKLRIEKLLVTLGYPGFEIEPLQHGLDFRNCVYRLTSPTDPDDKYILRVPNDPDLREDDKVCEEIINDAALLGFLADKLPVPRVVAYSASEDNDLTEPYTLQTCLPGMRLDSIWMEMEPEGKLAIIDQYVDLIAKLESITFPTAGTFTASPLEPVETKKFLPLTDPEITFFNKGEEEFMERPTTQPNRAGSDLKALMVSHIDGWVEKERKDSEGKPEGAFRMPYYIKMKKILDILEAEGSFDQPESIVLNHWDLEPRNIMVTPTATRYEITGIIDWDDALAMPRTLTRRPPEWIWDFERELFTGFFDTDAHPKDEADLSQESLALKNHFDSKAKAVLGDQYLEDAYGTGRLLRRIWALVKEFSFSTWYIDLSFELVAEWEDRLMESEAVPEDLVMSEDLPVLEPQAAEPESTSPDTLMTEQQADEQGPALSPSLRHEEQPAGRVAESEPKRDPLLDTPPVLMAFPAPEEQPAEGLAEPALDAEPELDTISALEAPPVSGSSPLSEGWPAEWVAEPEPERPMSLWAKIALWFRRYFPDVRTRL
ncbi:MAG: hypothetical protein Q9169_006843 [Polycauliona sp. 2 TL-2023]